MRTLLHVECVKGGEERESVWLEILGGAEIIVYELRFYGFFF